MELPSTIAEDAKVLEKILKALNDLKSDLGFVKNHIISSDQMNTTDTPIPRQKKGQRVMSTAMAVSSQFQRNQICWYSCCCCFRIRQCGGV